MKVMQLVFGIFGGVGLLLLAVGMFGVNSTRQWLEEVITAQGVVIRHSTYPSDGTTMYRPVIRFTDQNGHEVTFQSNASSSSPHYQTGDPVTVLYAADSPQQARINSFFSLWGMVLIVGGIGLVFTVLSGGFWGYYLRRTRREKWLRQHGRRIATTFKEVIVDSGTQVRGRYPYRIVSQWQSPRSRKVYVFVSADLWFDPTDYLGPEHSGRDGIWVFIKPEDPHQYVMDISFLPKLAD